MFSNYNQMEIACAIKRTKIFRIRVAEHLCFSFIRILKQFLNRKHSFFRFLTFLFSCENTFLGKIHS